MARLVQDPASIASRLLGASAAVLFAALLLWCAVKLIEAILVPLLVIAVVTAGGVAGWMYLRRRGW